MTAPARERLKAFRSASGLSQAGLAEHLQCDQTYVSKVEDGKRQPGPDFTHRLEALSKNWADGPIRTEEWVDDDALKVKPLTSGREARR